jgi:putative hydroxymethylpyrimidine transport system permease protein
MNEAKFTIFEALISLFLAILLGAFTASLIIFIKPARQWLLPTLVIFQAMPTFAIAPLLVLWLGYGMSSKIAITVLMIFFPITNSLYDGLRNTPLIWLDLANIMNASRFQTLKQIQWPAAMPAFASGLRYAAVIAPLGAILGEWVGSSAGLGYLLLDANITLNIDLMFATIIVIAAFTLALYFIIDACLEKCIHWSKQC